MITEGYGFAFLREYYWNGALAARTPYLRSGNARGSIGYH